MSETIEKETKPAPKVEKKAAAKPAAKAAKTTAKPTAKTTAKPAAKAETKSAPVVAISSDTSLYDIAENQLDATSEAIIGALTALDTQLKDARETGSEKAQAIIKEFGGENKITELIATLAGYMGQAAGAGMIAGMSPMIIMAGAAKGVYKKITD